MAFAIHALSFYRGDIVLVIILYACKRFACTKYLLRSGSGLSKIGNSQTFVGSRLTFSRTFAISTTLMKAIKFPWAHPGSVEAPSDATVGFTDAIRNSC
jgi:hypothetical protein